MQFHWKKKRNKQKKRNKKAKRVCLKFIDKHKKIRETKYLDQLRKKTSIVSSWSWSHSPIDNCSLSIRHKVNINHKQLAANTGYAATHYGNPGVSIYSFFSRSVKPVGGYKQLFNKLCINFLNGNRWNGFPPSCSYFCNCTKNPNSQ